MALLIPRRTPGIVRTLLAAGRRTEAAQEARAMVGSTTREELQELVEILAEQVQAQGDDRPRGRPPTNTAARAWLGLAIADRRALLICRELVDRRPVGPRSLAWLSWWWRLRLDGEPDGQAIDALLAHRAAQLAADPDLTAQLLEHLRPRAEAELSRWALRNIVRQKCRAKTREAVVKHYARRGITDADLREAPPKVCE